MYVSIRSVHLSTFLSKMSRGDGSVATYADLISWNHLYTGCKESYPNIVVVALLETLLFEQPCLREHCSPRRRNIDRGMRNYEVRAGSVNDYAVALYV